MSGLQWVTLFIALFTLTGVALGRYPVLRMNRATIVLVGSAALVISGIIPMQVAYQAIDMDTIVLLFSMMIINANLRLSGFFDLVVLFLVKKAKNPRQLLILLVFSSGILSALFLNDTICIMFTPIVIELVLALRRNPMPFLIGLATAANVGSVATIIGNPQNMLIGISSGISFSRFALILTPVALAGLFAIVVVIILMYREEFRGESFNLVPDIPARQHKQLLRKSLFACLLMLTALFAGMPVATASFGAASILLVTRRIKPHRVFSEINWGLLVFFAGLFVITHSLEVNGISNIMFERSSGFARQGVTGLSLVAAVLSNIVSNVPAVMLMRPLIPAFPQPDGAYLALAMATTFAGNLTLLGSVANLIVAESAKSKGVHLSFMEYFRIGLPITIVTLLGGIIWLSWIF